METTEALRILKEFNDWRRGVGIYEETMESPAEPFEIGIAIDKVIEIVSKTK